MEKAAEVGVGRDQDTLLRAGAPRNGFFGSAGVSPQAAEDEAEHQDGSGLTSQPPTAGDSRADSCDARR
jgi:hypothetical protein